MPPFRRFYWYRRNYGPYSRRPRRRRFRYRRPRRTIQRRYRKRRYWVRKFTRFFKKKKLKKIKITQWQPKIIHRCKIKGYKCLFQAGPNRDSNNYAQYQESFSNPHQPGGGGWSLLIFTLENLYEEHLKVRNWWTKSNKGLPLTRYNGCKFKFFRDDYTDYIVVYSLCYPMLDAPLVHANSSPYNTLISRHRIIVPSKKSRPRGKPYIKKWFKPPSQFKSKWYFTQDICKTGLIMLTTIATDLNYFYVSPNSINNNISIYTLNSKTFQNNGFINPPTTTGYSPGNGIYLYAQVTHELEIKVKDLAYLGRPGPYELGEPYTGQTDYTTNKKYWGNPFHPKVLNLDIPVFKSNTQPGNIFTNDNKDKKVSELNTLVRVIEPLIIELRYNPDRDTGQNNSAYLISIERSTSNTDGFKEPDDPNVKITGLPLPILLWGWLDWQKKLQYLHNIDTSYMLVLKSKFTTPEVQYILPVDWNFLQGNGPYGLPHEELNSYTLSSWWPKVAHQLVTNNEICHCGPATCKYYHSKSIQAHCSYQFNFRWGGCPAPMIDLTNPCLQPKFPVPDTQLQRLQIQDPTFKPELELHDFDQRHDQLTKKCIERIKDYTETEQTLLSLTGTNNPTTTTKRAQIQKEIQTSEQEKEEEDLQQQLLQLRKHQKLLKRAVLQLMKPNIE
nr:MAG: ORF1 [TTV-like mini virus]